MQPDGDLVRREQRPPNLVPHYATMARRVAGTVLCLLLLLCPNGAALTASAPFARAAGPASPWSHASSMPVARAYQAEVALADGRILAFGGVDPSGAILDTAVLYDPRTGRWTPAGRMAIPRAGAGAVRLRDGRVLVAGGATGASGSATASAELYDPHTGRWSLAASMHTARFDDTATLLPDGRVLVAGGVGVAGHALAGAELYDPRRGHWTVTGSLHAARAVLTATLLRDGRVLVAGGAAGAFGTGPVLSSVELYDPRSGRWTLTGRMAQARAYHTATRLRDGRVLVAGGASGQSDADAALPGAELYDPHTGRWTATGSMIEGRLNHTATLLPDGSVLVTGGQGESVAGQALSSAERYNPRTGTWTETAPMSTPRTGQAALALPNGTVLVAGGDGESASGPTLASAEVYNPHAPGVAAAPLRGRAQFAATLLPNGKVLVEGGVYDLPTRLARSSAELYDPHSGAWAPTGSMSQARASFSATLLRDGRVLVAGGFDSAGILSSAELYDPHTGLWASAASMHVARAYQTATPLPDGRVFVAGGLGNGGAALASAEVYDPRANRWTLTGSMAAGRASHTATLLLNGTVLAAGGVTGKSNAVLASAEVYDPRTGRWSRTGSMSAARAGQTATLLRAGRVLVAGGQEETVYGSALYSADLYDPRTGAWTAAASLTQGRIAHTATLLPNGTVLVAGGMDQPGSALDSAESYDPRADAWNDAGLMGAARTFHTAALLANGQVLVVGGEDAAGSVLAGVELYDPGKNVWSLTGSM